MSIFRTSSPRNYASFYNWSVLRESSNRSYDNPHPPHLATPNRYEGKNLGILSYSNSHYTLESLRIPFSFRTQTLNNFPCLSKPMASTVSLTGQLSNPHAKNDWKKLSPFSSSLCKSPFLYFSFGCCHS